MSLHDTRPPWLLRESDLESLLLTTGNYALPIADLAKSRHGCPLLDNLLDMVIRTQNANPSSYELSMARQHLAVELQQILRRWVEEGLRRTLADSFLGAVMDPAPPTTTPLKRRRTSTSGAPAEVQPSSAQMEKDFRCPYHVRDQRQHPECAGKRFPNPRKLKEHIWRFTRPFKCSNCGEGFGREKTRAIHCDQRKVPCVASSAANEYENSPENIRDKKIERAKTTAEIVTIFEEYDRDVGEGGSPLPAATWGGSGEYPTPPPADGGRSNVPDIVVTTESPLGVRKNDFDDFTAITGFHGSVGSNTTSVWAPQHSYARSLSDQSGRSFHSSHTERYCEEFTTPGYKSFPPANIRMRF